MSLELTPSRQEIREHNVLPSQIIPPPNNNARFRGSTLTVLIESDETRKLKKRRSRRVIFQKYGPTVCFTVCVLYLMRKLDDWFSLEPWVEVSPVSIQRDYSSIQSIEDLSSATETVDVWCHPSRSKCSCQDPLVADSSREISRWWARTHRINVDAASSKTDIDVLFLGDSITEGWRGTSRGHDIARAQGAQQVFTKHFEGGGNEAKYEGLALGIAGDTSTNLLWRIQNGELPDTLNPKVIWLLIGTNDFGNAWCSPELVLIGIIRVVEELRLRKPAATIVINGLLPRSFHSKGYVMRGRPSLFGRAPRLPSLWRDIVSVNEELRQYSLSRDKVEYFETNLFFVDKKAPREQLKINSHLMPDRLHPSADGYDLWAEQIVATLEELIVNR